MKIEEAIRIMKEKEIDNLCVQLIQERQKFNEAKEEIKRLRLCKFECFRLECKERIGKPKVKK